MTRRRRPGDRGAVLVFVAPMVLVLFSTAALVIDMGNARQEARHVQAAADAAALAGARELPIVSADATAAAEAGQQAALNVNANIAGASGTPTTTPCPSDAPPSSTCYRSGTATVVVSSPYVSSDPSAPPSYNMVYVRICQPTATFLAGVMGVGSPTVCRTAVGRRRNASGGYGMGLVVMDPTSCSALQFRGDSETVLSSNGAVMVNSSCTGDPAALDASGSNWNLVADYIGVVGGASLAPCDPTYYTACTTTQPTTGIPPFDDPLALSPPDPLPVATTTPCPSSYSGSGVKVMQPGRYSGYCKFDGDRQYIFRPGTYYFDVGFESAGSAVLVCSNTATTYPLPADSTCDGVTFIVGGNKLTMAGSGQVYLPPPSTGPYAGVSIYQISSTTSSIAGNNNFYLGTIYAPNATMNFTGTAGSHEVNIHGMVVTKMADISGAFQFNIQVPTDAPETFPEDDFGLWE